MRTTRPRRGLATVEFVMVLPILMLLAVLIIKSGEVTIQKISANVNARRTIYEAPRGSEGGGLPNRSMFSKPLGVKDGTAGLATAAGTSTKPVSLRPVVSKSATYNGKVACLMGTWDHKSIDSPPHSMNNPLPSRAMTAIGAGGSGVDLGSVFGGGPPDLGDALSGVTQALGPAVPVIESAQTFLEGITTILDGISSGISSIFGDSIGSVLTGPFDKLTQAIKDANKILELVRRLFMFGTDRLVEDF